MGGGDIRRARVLMRVENVGSVTQLRSGEAEHAAQLPAADDADRGTWRDDHSGASGIAAVCSAR